MVPRSIKNIAVSRGPRNPIVGDGDMRWVEVGSPAESEPELEPEMLVV